MQTVILVIHLMLAVSLVGVVLLQRSEGGGLGIGGGGGMGGLMSGRGSANLLTRVTAVLAALFMATSLTLAILATGADRPRSVLDTPAFDIPVPAAPAPAEAPAAPASPAVPPAAPTSPASPAVPLGQ
ncbi:MAG: preprotein translocase subunit SecG [Dongiaceae bacterium]